jgi:putative sterol carrier protein
VLRYLSLDWIDALSAEVAASADMAAVAADHSVGVTQVVSDGPEGTVVYHLQVAQGQARFGAGPAEPEDLRFEQDWTTAVDVATGALNAQEAFLAGRIRLFGDPPTLMANQAVFRALDGAFSAVRERTDYT